MSELVEWGSHVVITNDMFDLTIRLVRGRYTFYWNAFLLTLALLLFRQYPSAILLDG